MKKDENNNSDIQYSKFLRAMMEGGYFNNPHPLPEDMEKQLENMMEKISETLLEMGQLAQETLLELEKKQANDEVRISIDKM